jgi:hypothetical protein
MQVVFCASMFLPQATDFCGWLCLLAVSSCVAGVEGSEAWFLLGLQGEWFSDTAGLGDCGGDLACIVAALRYCVDYVAAL